MKPTNRTNPRGLKQGDPVKLHGIKAEDRGVIIQIHSDGVARVLWNDGITDHIHCSDIERADTPLHSATVDMLRAFSRVRWTHTSGKHAEAVRSWQAAGCPDLPVQVLNHSTEDQGGEQ